MVDDDHPFAKDVMQLTHAKYVEIADETEKRNLFKTIMCSLCKITSFSIKTTWLWLPVLVSVNVLEHLASSSGRKT